MSDLETEATVRWFGQKHDAPVYNDCPRIEAPVGRECVYCTEPISAGEDGFLDAGDSAFHRACFLRMVFGSISHQAGTCTCFNPKAGNSVVEKLSLREEAEAAVAFHEKHHQHRGDGSERAQ